MPFLMDLIILGIFAVCIFFAYRKGLVATLFGLFGTVLALCLAIALRVPVGHWISDSYVRQPVRQVVLNAICDMEEAAYEDVLAATDVAGEMIKMPASLKILMKTAGVSEADLLKQALNSQEGTETIKNELIDLIAKPIADAISTALAFVLLFAIFSVVMFFLARILRSLCRKLPLGEKIDKIGGGVVGGIKAIVIVFVLTALVWAIGTLSEEGMFSAENVEKTILTEFFTDINPICNLFR